LGGLLDDRPGGLLAGVPLGGGRAHDLAGEAVHPVAEIPLFLGQVERELGHDQALGMSKSWGMLAARPRSPLAFSLHVMNIIIGLPLPETILRKSTGPTLTASFGSCSAADESTHARSAMTSS